MQIVLLAGGLGSRLAEETTRIPKPMVEVAGRPVIVRVMDIYSHFGHRNFLVAAGYKSVLLKQFFLNFHLASNDVTVDVGTGDARFTDAGAADWEVSIVDTGATAMTGGRLLRLRDWLDGGTFMVTYSDGLGNIDIDALLAFHKSHGKLATVTAVQPPARFGNLELDGDQVSAFTEKVRRHETWINGGYFVFEPGVLDYIDGDSQPLEQEPLTRIAEDGQLMAYKHHGFWHPMDTVRDRDFLAKQCDRTPPPWLDFDAGAEAARAASTTW
ncbi:glucose-1-phosphate cytidylyltransferase [Oceanomicrobium pacificus]|uniref:Glucose-1-phosphate cytidylyltransferase n=1 Tax=Oceanomicrobium pacificus TaxID=2692916 RepID=A0A6B0TL19_9RHOB|nr:glucose-1-phosphate cytidylyltransferase [Oceanomicrobium pacificus]MXU65220.1 glucose-1-phosphate cytidylyltransferase [Oceanomicrobium pacificus]